MTRWSFAISWPATVAGLAVLAGSAWLCLQHWRRSGARRLTLGLEALRWFIVLLIFFTLMRPERVRSVPPPTDQEVLILTDASRSMRTMDIRAADGGVTSRLDWARGQAAGAVLAAVPPRFCARSETFSDCPTNAAAPTAGEGTDIHAALLRAVAGRSPARAVVLLSDGDANSGPPPVSAATRLEREGVPVYAIGVGGRGFLPDVELADVVPPSYGILGEQVFIAFTLRNRLDRELVTSVTLSGQGQVLSSRPLTVPAGGEARDALLWRPLQEGEAALEVTVPVERGELRSDNNRTAFTLAVRRETLSVLVIESLPRWEYRYLRNALSRDPMVEASCVLLHPGGSPASGPGYLPAVPSTREALSAFDVVFLGDVGIGPGELTAEDAERIRGLVEQQASGLVFLPGRRGRHLTLAGSPLEALYPVVMDPGRPEGLSNVDPWRFGLTRLGRGHMLTLLAEGEEGNSLLWSSLPGFGWCAPVLKAKPGSDVLAVNADVRNESGLLPLLVTRAAGAGKTLFLGTDSAWRWRCGVEDLYHYRFWGQVVRWMSYQRHRAHAQGFRLAFAPDSPSQGDRVSLHATVFDAAGVPVPAAQLTAEIAGPGGTSETVIMEPVAGGWGVHIGSVVLREAGAHRVRLASGVTGRTLEAELSVRGVIRELEGRPVRTDILEELAVVSGGRFVAAEALPELLQQLRQLPEPPPVERRFALWAHPAWGALILGLLVVYWIGRKLAGLI